MVIDMCPINHELDILEIRLRTLWDVVDKFVVAEIPVLYKGSKKPLHLTQNLERFKPYYDKLVVLTVTEEFVFKNLKLNWVPNDIEKFQRNMLRDWAYEHYEDDDIVIHGDVDEIPHPRVIGDFREHGFVKAVLITRLYRYYYDLYFQDWNHLFIARLGQVKKHKCWDSMRKHQVNNWHRIEKAGWHFSAVGDFDHILKKFSDMNCFGPAKNNKRLVDPERVKKRIEARLHPFKEGKNPGRVVPVETLPKCIAEDEKFHKNLLGG